MNEELGQILLATLITSYFFWRLIWLKRIPALTHTDSAPAFLGSHGIGGNLGFLDLMLRPKWQLKELGDLNFYNTIELSNGEILKKVFIAAQLDDYMQRGRVADLILARNTIVGIVTENKQVYSVERYKGAVEAVTKLSARTVN